MDINKINGTLAGQIAQKLDAADGKKDGKISASIWNDFVKDKGGKQIQNFISIESAMNSITTYSVRQANKTQGAQNADSLAKTWLKTTEEVKAPAGQPVSKQPIVDNKPPKVDPNPPKTDTNPPKADANPPKAKEDVLDLIKKNKSKANQTVKYPDGGAIEYDEDGFIAKVYDENGNVTKDVERYYDGTVDSYEEFEYNKDGNNTKTVHRNSDGTVYSYEEFEYNKDGKVTKIVFRKADGSVSKYNEYEYDKNGNTTKDVCRNADGSVRFYSEYEYDKNGNMTRLVIRDANGSCELYS